MKIYLKIFCCLKKVAGQGISRAERGIRYAIFKLLLFNTEHSNVFLVFVEMADDGIAVYRSQCAR